MARSPDAYVDTSALIAFADRSDSHHALFARLGDTALRLAHFFGTSAQFWLNLQSLYELRIAEEKVGTTIKKLPTLKRLDHAHA